MNLTVTRFLYFMWFGTMLILSRLWKTNNCILIMHRVTTQNNNNSAKKNILKSSGGFQITFWSLIRPSKHL